MHLIRSLGFLSFAIFLIGSMSSCLNSKKAVYFNDIPDTVLTNQMSAPDPSIQKGDLLSISVTSLNPDASVLFNLSNLPSQAASSINSPLSSSAQGASVGGSGGSSPMQSPGYLVNSKGFIKFPVIGKILVEGKNKEQLEDTLENILDQKKLLTNPIVTVRFLNFRVSVIGEVTRPTTINVSNDKISILEALGLAGDITVYGKKDNVLLIREEQSTKVIKRIDLNSRTILSSPYYYLRTNDIVYVEPRKEKILSTSRTQQLLPIIISALSFAAIISSYYLKK